MHLRSLNTLEKLDPQQDFLSKFTGNLPKSIFVFNQSTVFQSKEINAINNVRNPFLQNTPSESKQEIRLFREQVLKKNSRLLVSIIKLPQIK